jgi:transposase-like protein
MMGREKEYGGEQRAGNSKRGGGSAVGEARPVNGVSGGLIDELKKRLAERMLNAEMDHHLASGTNKRPAITAMVTAARP